jgi:hypothetical protein
MTLPGQTNRLINETSPYLLQHAHNPVDWFPWGYEAFNRARAEDKPVFLSVGYSSCRWCHVMERESFADREVAEVLRKNFVSVKLDREERPDVDHVYMTACMAMRGSGGWPLNVFMTPGKAPFYAGTYYTKESFLTLLEGLSADWRKNRRKILSAADRVLKIIDENAPARFAAFKTPSPGLAEQAASSLMQSYDARWGGFGKAPKFPAPHNLMFLMRAARNRPKNSPEWSALRHTLAAMAAGGLRDHVGGGFHRYSTDRMWLAPHFEKMLYDNALLAMAYTECYEKTGEFAPIVREIIAYVKRELQAPGGLFYTAQDAESEGVEGKYYCWTPGEIKAVLGEKDGTRFSFLYDITDSGNFERKSLPNLIRMPLSGDDMVFASICLPRLLEARNTRPAPMRDGKVLLTSNALMAAALAKAGRALEEPSYTHAAETCAASLLETMQYGRGLTAVMGGTIHATLDGYSYLTWALLEVYTSTLNSRWLDEACVIGGLMLEHFSTPGGLLCYTASDCTDLPVRAVNACDGVTPSGQSVAAHCMLRLSRLTGDAVWEDAVKDLLASLSGALEDSPESFAWMMAALLHIRDGGADVTLTPGDGLTALRAALRGFRPFMTVRLDEADSEPMAKAYVCTGDTCLAPVTEPAALGLIVSQQDRDEVGAPR